MSKIVSQNTAPVVVHQIGNLTVTASEPDDGGVLLLKVAALIVGGMAAIGVSPIIGASLWGYAVLKITGLVSSVDSGSGLGQQLRDDLLGKDEETADRPSNIPADAPRYLPSENTRLGAIEVSAQEMPSPHPKYGASAADLDSSWRPVAVLNPLDKVRAVVARNNSFYVVGSKGAGKGMFVANMLRWKLEQYPNAIAFVLDPKGDVKESGYWQHPRIKLFSFKGIALSSSDLAMKVIEFLAEARNLMSQADVVRGMRLFLTFDEFLFLKTNLSKELFGEVSNLCSNAISTGDSEGIHAIAITQSFNAGDSVGSDEILKNLTQVGLFRQDEYLRAKKQVNYGRVNADQFSDGEFKRLSSLSPVGRVMSLAGEFMSTPALENFSSFDRDSGELIKPLATGFDPSEGDHLAREAMKQVETVRQSQQAVKVETSDRFTSLAKYLIHESQADLKSFVLWLSKKKGEEMSFDQIKDNFARRNLEKRSKDYIDSLIQTAIEQGLVTVLSNSNYRVSED